MVTARAENLIRGVDDLDDTIRRLQAYQEAGADVLYAPGLRRIEECGPWSASVDRPVNALMFASGLDVAALAEAGVARISVGGALAWVSWAAVADAARRLLSDGAPFDREVVKAGGGTVTAALG